MSLPVLCSLALMLLLFASLLHLACLILPAWIQMAVFVPRVITALTGDTVAEGGGESVEVFTNVTAVPLYSAVDYLQDRLVFVKVRLGLWEWCEQFRQVDPNCQHPGFLGGVMVMGLVVLITGPVCFVLLAVTSCMDMDTKKKRAITLASFILASLSGLLLLLAVMIYAILTRREVNRMLRQTGENRELPYLGWAYGAEVMVCVLVCLAAVCLGIHLRSSPRATPEFQLVV